MGKAGRWLRHLLTGSKEKKSPESRAHSSPSEFHSGPISASRSKEKKRWSFRRPTAAAATGKALCPSEKQVNNGCGGIGACSEVDRRRHAMAVAAATTAAADAALAAAQAAATIVMHLTTSADVIRTSAVEEAAAVKIQAAFRSYLARKALLALKGLVKLQALVRGRLVRKQATATMRCMQALIKVQARAQQHKFRMLGESAQNISHQQSGGRSWSSSSSQHQHCRRHPYENDKSAEENVKIVEMDIGQAATRRKKHGHGATHGSSSYRILKVDSPYALQQQQQILAATSSAPTDISLRSYSGRFGECSYSTVQNSPQYSSGAASIIDDRRKLSLVTSRSEGTQQGSHDNCFYVNGIFPNYMANTESSRAKARSQSAPKQRSDDTWERSQAVGRRRTSLQLEGRSVPRNGCGMQRSSSLVKPATNLYPVGCIIKLDRSNASLGDGGRR